MQSMSMQKSNKKYSWRMPYKWFLLILVCYVAHTAKYLADIKIGLRVKICQPQNLTQCAKIVVGFMANVAKFLSNVFFLIFFPRFLRF